MKKSRLHLSLLVVAMLLGALAVTLMDGGAPAVGVARAAQGAATATATPASGVISPLPALNWMTPSNANPIGVPGESVTVAGSGFDVSGGTFLVQLESASALNAGCPATITPSHVLTETTATFQATFTIDATAKAGAQFVVCAFPTGKGQVVHSKTLTLVAPVVCPDGACGASATDSVALGTQAITVTGKDWEPIGGLVTITLCCNAAAPSPTHTAAPTSIPQSQPTRTPIILPTITITPPKGLDRELSAQGAAFAAPITQTVTIAPCADNAATGCFTVGMPLPTNAKVGDTFTLTAQAQGNAVVTRGPVVKIVAAPTQSGGGLLATLGGAVPELFLAIILLLLVMAGILVWLATRREAPVGRQV